MSAGGSSDSTVATTPAISVNGSTELAVSTVDRDDRTPRSQAESPARYVSPVAVDGGSTPAGQSVRTAREALAEMHIRAPSERNRRLTRLLEAVNSDLQVKAWWHASAVNAARLRMSDHSWVHIQIVLNIALRLARLLFRAGVKSSVVADHGLEERDAEVVLAAASLFHW
jgi:hypothetical protein